MKRNLEKKIAIFLDTNVFLHFKSFSSINWSKLINEFEAKISIIIPHQVLKELDEKKYSIKKARNTINKFKRIEKKGLEFQDNVYLQLPDRSPDWSILTDRQAKNFDRNINDDNTLVEILIFRKENPLYEIIIISNDYTFQLKLRKYNIKVIDPADDDFSEFFRKETTKPMKLPDLLMLFKDKKDSKLYSDIEINIKDEEIELMDYVPTNESSLFNFEHVINLTTKSAEEYNTEIRNYNEKLEEYNKYKKIYFVLSNHSDHSYQDIFVFFTLEVEQGFDFKFAEDISLPEKPSRNRPLFFMANLLNYNIPSIRESDEIHIKPKKKSTKKNTIKWEFGYRIKSLHHQMEGHLQPILMKLPENVKTEVITLYCHFSYEEPRRIKDQKLRIYLK
ncbi:MAG: hypothetical protein BAJALOKI1v1_60002 [Promethearchaeota archaeon]|nr:MAG: hypothetical protein BAJALOKI1v1_60002 [Candidatus Lokiarchaeota archaeon]